MLKVINKNTLSQKLDRKYNKRNQLERYYQYKHQQSKITKVKENNNKLLYAHRCILKMVKHDLRAVKIEILYLQLKIKILSK